jgi:hypothetical protein
VAKNFLACEHFFHIYFEAFNSIFLGWPLGAKKQVDTNCIFGVLLAVQWSFEESSRRGLHGHAPLYSPTINAKNLQALFQRGEDFQKLLLDFAEGLARSWIPRANDADEFRLLRVACEVDEVNRSEGCSVVSESSFGARDPQSSSACWSKKVTFDGMKRSMTDSVAGPSSSRLKHSEFDWELANETMAGECTNMVRRSN